MMRILIITSVLSALFLVTGCELGMNPFIFDGTVTSDPVWVNSSFPVIGVQQSIDLSDARLNAQQGSDPQIDSVKFYNLLLMFDSTGGTPAGTSLTGILMINTDTLATLTNVPVIAFNPERSIFDQSLPGWRYNNAGVQFLMQTLRNPNPPPVMFTFGAIASNTPISFRARVKVHAQVFTSP